MSSPVQVERTSVNGRYELVGVDGRLLPASMGEAGAGPGGQHHIVGGELRLVGDGSYILELTLRSNTAAAEMQTISSGGAWRFLPSALDPTAGEIRLGAGPEQTSAAVTGVSLVHRARPPWLPGESPVHWVYIRRSQDGG